MKHILVMIVALAFSAPVLAHDEEAAVKAAVMDYALAFYKGEPERLERSVWKNLSKRGFWRNNPEAKWTDVLTMSFDQATALSKTYYKSLPADIADPVIRIFEVSEKIATARVDAQWGFDYVQLAKMDGKWMIINVLWQAKEAEGE